MNLEYRKRILTHADIKQCQILKNGHIVDIEELLEDLTMLPKLIKTLTSVSEALMPPLDKGAFKTALKEQEELFEWLDKNQITD